MQQRKVLRKPQEICFKKHVHVIPLKKLCTRFSVFRLIKRKLYLQIKQSKHILTFGDRLYYMYVYCM